MTEKSHMDGKYSSHVTHLPGGTKMPEVETCCCCPPESVETWVTTCDWEVGTMWEELVGGRNIPDEATMLVLVLGT